MASLADFRCPILVGGDTLGDGCRAYRLDGCGERGIPDMRKLVGLESCECVGYFCRRGDEVALMGDVNLVYEAEQGENQAAYLVGGYKRAHADALTGWKISSRVYSSLLLLCRLAVRRGNMGLFREVWEETKGGEYVFWLVVYNEVASHDIRVLDNLRTQLSRWLRGVLKVKVMRRDEFERSFPPNDSRPRP